MADFAASPIVPPYGTIDLADKHVPVCDIFPAKSQNVIPLPSPYASIEDAPPLCVTRAELDVTAFKEHLLSLPDHMWDDDSQDGNVKLMRPAHDKWGIKKIVFTFCDDFLLKVLDLPWSSDPAWQPHLDAIYEAVGVDKRKVVRSLLASMPPGVDIPVHHDTGHWVKHCHRVHVPIITGPDVQFLVGANEDVMASFLFNEGRVVELNNQAKHSVTNNMKDTHRVHLIFDYVEDYPLSRYTVQPGQKIVQTRRSIDFDPDDPLLLAGGGGAALKTLRTDLSPSFIILGAQKAGTTSLYEYICEHPLVCRGKRRETHYFDWRWNDKLTTPEQHRDYYLNFFHREALHAHASIVTGESTPSYLLHSDVVLPRLLSTLGAGTGGGRAFKLLVMLRDPTARAYSQYNMTIDMNGNAEQKQNRGSTSYINTSFEEIVEREIAHLTALGITPDTDRETFREKALAGLPMGHGGHSLVLRGLYALQLAPWCLCFPLHQQLRVLGLRELGGPSQEVQKKVNSVYGFIGLPPHDIPDVAPKNTRAYPPISPETKARLDAYYAPFNAKLFDLLGEELRW